VKNAIERSEAKLNIALVTRPKIPQAIEIEVLRSSARRCAFCFGLRQDFSEKRGQIAHLNHKNGDNALSNLAFLCFDHHEEYDITSFQAKRLTIGEAVSYRDELYEVVRNQRAALMQLLESSIQAKNQQNIAPLFNHIDRQTSQDISPSQIGFDEIFESFNYLGEECLVAPSTYGKTFNFAWGTNDGEHFFILVYLEFDFSAYGIEKAAAWSLFLESGQSKRMLKSNGDEITLNAYAIYLCVHREPSTFKRKEDLLWLDLRCERMKYIAHELRFYKEWLSVKKVSAGPAFTLGIADSIKSG
jgi:hypothetical protein